ncbi:MAG: ankyrin repeat domain-containing protein, partial [Planctomycetes bacterium]|nr:ankyrin repeat domain-containing protein [Planctomycetota bacterium]
MHLQELKLSALMLLLFTATVSGGEQPAAKDSIEFRLLVQSINADDEKAVKAMLDTNAELVNTAGKKEGNRPLHHAVSRNSTEIVRLLLARKADVNARSKNGSTPLLFACLLGRNRIAKQLIQAKADLNAAESDNGFTPLHYAIATSNSVLARTLLVQGAKPGIASLNGRTPLHLACRLKSALLVKLLLEKKADVNAQPKIGKRTPLHDAASAGSADIVKILLGRKAKVNPLTDKGISPLHLACMYKHTDVAGLLL